MKIYEFGAARFHLNYNQVASFCYSRPFDYPSFNISRFTIFLPSIKFQTSSHNTMNKLQKKFTKIKFLHSKLIWDIKFFHAIHINFSQERFKEIHIVFQLFGTYVLTRYVHTEQKNTYASMVSFYNLDIYFNPSRALFLHLYNEKIIMVLTPH